MKPKLLSNALIEPNENELESSLLLSQLLLSQVGPKEEEKLEEKLKQIPKDQYLCPKCLIPHEIRHINEDSKEIEIHCVNKCQTKYTIKDYLTHICKISYYYYKCEVCKKKIQKSYKIEEGNIFKYCFECNKILCLQCYDFLHQKLNHKNIVPCNEIFNKCAEHPGEDYIQFCINCSSHLCPKCIFSPHKGHILVTLNSILPTQKEIDKFKNKKEEYINKKKELLKQYEDIENLIYLNDLVLQTYLKHQKNYYYIINVLNLYNIDINSNQNNETMNNNNIHNNNIDDDDDIEDFINRCNTADKRIRNYYKRKVNLRTEYDNDSKETSLINNTKNISSFNKNERKKINRIPDNDTNNIQTEKKYLKDILTNIVKNKERKERSQAKEDKRDRFEKNERESRKNMANREKEEEKQSGINLGKRRIRHCSQEIRTNLDLEDGNEFLEKFNKEFGNKPFLNKRKVELFGAKMGKDGLLVLLNNKHKFIELEELVLSRVKLNSLDFLENIFIDRLRVLNLELNKISSINIFQYLNLKNLESLNLSNNSISSIDIFPKISMSNLQYLYLSRNYIDSIDGLARANLSKLKGLYLSENKINDISILSKVSFFYLNELFLNSNNINNIDVFKEVNFPYLKMLNLSCNKIVSIESLGKMSCTKIEEMNLRLNVINNIEPLSKANLSLLKDLHLDNNKITDISCLNKNHLKSLQRLYINNNIISNINLFRNNPFPKLDTLTLGGNKINNKERNTKRILEDLHKKKIYISL